MEKFRTVQIGRNKRLAILSLDIISGVCCITKLQKYMKSREQESISHVMNVIISNTDHLHTLSIVNF